MQLVLEVCEFGIGDDVSSARKVFSGVGGVIGRGAGCDWVIPDPSRLVSNHHGLVAWREGRYFLTDISSNGIGVEGTATRLRKGQAWPIKDGEVFQLGPLSIRAQLVEPLRSGATQEAGVCEPIPEDVFLGLDPIHTLDREDQQRTASQDLDALNEPLGVHEQWVDHSAAHRDHMAIPRRIAVDPIATAAQPIMPTSGDTVFWTAFANALGVDLDALDPSAREALAIKVAQLLRLSIEGLQQGLKTCEELKGELKLTPADIGLKRRTPLHVNLSTDAALAMLLGLDEVGSVSAVQAIGQAHRDLQAHQVALMAACRSAIRSTRAAFAPGYLLTCFEHEGKPPRFSTDAGRWRAYQRHYRRLVEISNGDDHLPGGDFARAYEEQLRLISTLHIDYSG